MNKNGKTEEPEEFPPEDFPVAPLPTPLNRDDMKVGSMTDRSASNRAQLEEFPTEDFPPAPPAITEKLQRDHDAMQRRRPADEKAGGQAEEFEEEFPRVPSPVPLDPDDTKRRKWSAEETKMEEQPEEFLPEGFHPPPTQEKWYHNEAAPRGACIERNGPHTGVMMASNTKDALGHSPPTPAPVRTATLVTHDDAAVQPPVEPVAADLPAPGAVWVYPNGVRSDDTQMTDEHADNQRFLNDETENHLPSSVRLPDAAVNLAQTENRDPKYTRRRRICIGAILLVILLVPLVAVSITLSRKSSSSKDSPSSSTPPISKDSPSPSTPPSSSPVSSSVRPVTLFGRDWDPQRTTVLSLSRSFLTGTIPSQMDKLTQLTYLDLQSNSLTGTIPSQMGKLTQLTYLDLHRNSLTGTIPSQMGIVTQLTYLDLESSSLTGTIPSQMGKLTQLKFLDLGSNSLTGSIPAAIGSVTNLAGLSLLSNSLTGSIPTTIGQLSELMWLSLIDSTMSGSIPAAIGSLTKLAGLSLSFNSLTGSIPTTIGRLTQITMLSLSFNSLTGFIPSEISLLSKLTWLDLRSNSLTGSIPTEIGSLTKLTGLSLHSNTLSGPVPTNALANLVNLDLALFLYDNRLSGSIPSSLCSLDITHGIAIDCGEIGCDCCLEPYPSTNQCP